LNLENGEVRAEDPSSERWLEYYREAKVRRRARGPALRTRVQLRRYRARQRILIVCGFTSVGILLAIFYFVLER
jgi:hypothetical protein